MVLKRLPVAEFPVVPKKELMSTQFRHRRPARTVGDSPLRNVVNVFPRLVIHRVQLILTSINLFVEITVTRYELDVLIWRQVGETNRLLASYELRIMDDKTATT